MLFLINKMYYYDAVNCDCVQCFNFKLHNGVHAASNSNYIEKLISFSSLKIA
jgi:hypothetical protein